MSVLSTTDDSHTKPLINLKLFDISNSFQSYICLIIRFTGKNQLNGDLSVVWEKKHERIQVNTKTQKFLNEKHTVFHHHYRAVTRTSCIFFCRHEIFIEFLTLHKC